MRNPNDPSLDADSKASAAEPSAYRAALQLRAAGRLAEAGQACESALRENPKHGATLHLLAGLAYGAGRVQEALQLMARAADVSPDNPGVHSDLGLMYLMFNRSAEAVPVLQRAITLNPGQAILHNNLGIALKDLGRLDAAETSYRTALSLDQRYAPAHHNLGEVLQRTGHIAEARRCFETALALDPRINEARINLANILHDQGDLGAAADLYRTAIAASASPAWLHTSLGIVLKDMGDREAAVAAFRQALVANPNLAEAHLNLALAQLEFGDAADALASVSEALRLAPRMTGGWALYCTALAARGDLEAAAAELKKELAPGTSDGECWELLGVNLMNARRTREALQCFERRLLTDPDNAAALHYVASLSGRAPDRPSDDYVRNVFDQYADTFDASLVGELGYSVPKELVAATLETVTAPGRPWDVLDLGCGTGLVGAEIASQAKRLVGVDLSQKMLDRARERGIYSELHCGELMSAFEGLRAPAFDAVIAGDVFVYMGRLDAVVAAVRRSLRSDGLFAFTVEAAEDAAIAHSGAATEGFFLTLSGRYAHRAEYLRQLAADGDFEVRLMCRTRLRSERRRPVWGWLNVWSARGGT